VSSFKELTLPSKRDDKALKKQQNFVGSSARCTDERTKAQTGNGIYNSRERYSVFSKKSPLVLKDGSQNAQ